MARRLPSLSSLRAFEAAARRNSFKDAALELSVTPTAISHQIRSLEEQTGLLLFERRTRQVVLTEAGEQLFPVIRDGFDSFATVLTRLMHRDERPRVTVSATTAFTAKWLLPRLASFRRLYPAIDLQLHASDETVDLSRSEIDLAIRYGDGPYAGLESRLLFADTFGPVANPLLRLHSLDDLAGATRIDFAWARDHPANPTWERWFESVGQRMPMQAQLRFSDEGHALQAAIAGQGVALASLTLAAEDMAAGRLLQLFPQTLSGYTYHLLCAESDQPDSTRAVADWLCDVAGASPSEVSERDA